MTKEKFFNILNEEITNQIGSLLELSIDVDRDNVIDEIMSDHRDDLMSDFANYCGRYTIKDAVLRYIRANYPINKGEDNDKTQLSFEGFPRVQQAYAIIREDKQLIVVVEKLTIDEVDYLANELRKKAKGLSDHANQLIAFYQSIKKNV